MPATCCNSTRTPKVISAESGCRSRAESALPLGQADRFQLFHRKTLHLSPGDVVRITHNGHTADGKHRLDNGSLYRVRQFDQQRQHRPRKRLDGRQEFRPPGSRLCGRLRTHRRAKRSIGCSSASRANPFPASSREQFYVSVSRARKGVVVYTDDKEALREAVQQSEERVSATELLNDSIRRQAVMLREQQQEREAEKVQQQERERVAYAR